MAAIGTSADRFPSGMLLTVRPAAGARGLCLVAEDLDAGAAGRVWDPGAGTFGPRLPFGVGFGSLLTPDGAWVIDLDDNGGSEVGALVARSMDGSRTRVLTPGRDAIVMRGLETTRDGSHVLATVVDDDGHHVLWIPFDAPEQVRTLHSSPEEVWFAHVSADATLVCADTTDHKPGVRRPAVTVFDVATGAVVAVANDLPDGPIRAVRFSAVAGDQRVLLSTERTGFARPAIWDPVSGERRDYDLPEFTGETLVLDWHAATGTILLVDASEGIQRLLVLDEHSGAVRVLRDEPGSYAEPDVADVFAYYSQSFLGPDGRAVIVTSNWTTPLHLRRETEVVLPPIDVPPGQDLESVLVESADGTRVQLWWAAPPGPVRGTILDVHGGPNLVSLNQYRPALQAWLDHGFAVATLNYRGSVMFGRAIREGFWGGAGDREIEDIDAAIRWLRGRGLAEPATTYITGPSYGGHLSLLSIGRLPSHFAGAFAVVAMADWQAAWAEMNPALRKTWTSFLSMDTTGEVDPRRIDEALIRFSAINHVAAVTASAWLFQGSRDTRTPPTQARTYADALRAAGGDVIVEWFDAGHEPTGIDSVREEFERELELATAHADGRRWATLADQRDT
ncbi:prolyl oligopeptidase family serine peptidase [Amycolatopsis sp. GM8]|uniref:S9 family peptidase n=1 Tax=Amycolatopsis sp. GM8 TaxID=2896530 RepID=UPI001F02F8F3|nr:prolyl oligopeptidase family serine peptidase [Amycolatopsis sp. GM8]